MNSTDTRPRLSERFAVAAGVTVRRIGLGFFGTMGPLLVALGFYLAWQPLGFIALGLIFWALDRRVP